MKGKQKESAGWSSGSYSVKSTVEELAEVVRKAEGGGWEQRSQWKS